MKKVLVTGVAGFVGSNLAKLKDHQSEISNSDIYTYRRIKPEDRGLSW